MEMKQVEELLLQSLEHEMGGVKVYTAAVAWVRREYHPRAVETPWQRWWLRRVR